MVRLTVILMRCLVLLAVLLDTWASAVRRQYPVSVLTSVRMVASVWIVMLRVP